MLIYISGGQRSGKSGYAQQKALELADRPYYLATARCLDKDFEQRILRHKADRDHRWHNVEEEKYLSQVPFPGQAVVVVDCITLWLTNFFMDNQGDIGLSLEQAKKEWGKLVQQNITIIAISNEIGMSLHAETAAGRKFTDLQGWMNQFIAQQSDEAFLMMSGIPIKIR